MINNKHLVSVGVPTYNRAESLKKAISSVISQTYSNLEIIISDNASTDETQKVCEDFCQLDPRILYIRQSENLGAFNNFKFVLDKARGEYFMWLGDDDFIDIDYISKCLYFLLDNQDYILCSGIAQYFAESSNFYGEIIELNSDSFYSRITSYLNKVHYNGVFYGLYSRQKLQLIFSFCKKINGFAGDWILVTCVAFIGKIKTLVDTCIHRKEQEKTTEEYTSVIARSSFIERIYPYSYISINIYQAINSLTHLEHGARYWIAPQLYLLFLESLKILSFRFGYLAEKSTNKLNVFWILRKLTLKLKYEYRQLIEKNRYE